MERESGFWLKDSDVIFSMLGYPDDVESVRWEKMGGGRNCTGTMMIDNDYQARNLQQGESKMIEESTVDGRTSEWWRSGSSGCNPCDHVWRRTRSKHSPYQVVGREIAWFGPAGSGQQAKVANQLIASQWFE